MKEYLIKDLGKVITGNTPSKKIKEFYDNNDIPFIKPDGIRFKEITPLINANEYISEIARKKARVVRKHSVLITCIGNIGKVGVVDIEEISFNQQINAVVTNKLVLPRYFAYNLVANQKRLEAIANAPVIPLINKTQFENFAIKIHVDINDQEKISSILDSLSLIISHKSIQISEYDQLIKSRFVEQFDKYPKVELDKIAKLIMGQSPESSSYNDDGDGIPFFQGKGDFGDKYTIINHYTNRPKKIANKDSVLMSVRAPVGPVNIANAECCIGRGLCSIDGIPGKTYNEFLYNSLNALQDEIAGKGTGSTFKAIGKDDVLGLLLPNAPLDEQKNFSDFAKHVDTLKFVVRQSLDETKTLFDSLMQEYFG